MATQKRSRTSIWIAGWLLLVALCIVAVVTVQEVKADPETRTFSIQSRGMVTWTDSTGTEHTKSPTAVQTDVLAED